MKIKSILFLLQALLSLTMLRGDSNVVLDGSSVDTGIVWNKTKAEIEMEPDKINKQEFIFTNNSPLETSIINVKPSCGCVIANFPKEPIPVGASKKVILEVKSSGRKNDFYNTVVVQFSNGAVFILKCNIILIGAPIVEPTQLVWKLDSIESQSIEINSSHSKGAILTSIESSNQDYLIKQNWDNENQKWIISVSPFSGKSKPAILTINMKYSGKSYSYYVLLSKEINKT